MIAFDKSCAIKAALTTSVVMMISREFRDLASRLFRLTGDLVLPTLKTGKEDFLTTFMRFGTAFNTDFEFEHNQLWAGEGELEFVPSILGFQTFKDRIPGVARFRPRAYLHAEFGTAVSDRSALTVDQKDFVRLGPALSLEIAPDFRSDYWKDLNARLLLTLKYDYYASIQGGADLDTFTASLDWTLDAKGHFKLSAEYQNGALELIDQRVETFQIGLGIAF
jgi:hypothetical protein